VPFGAAISYHPVSALASGEVIGAAIEAVGRHPDLAVLAATPGHTGALEDIADAVVRLLAPSLLLGAVARSVGVGAPGGARSCALALWAGTPGPLRAVTLPPGSELPPGPGRVLLLATGPPEDAPRPGGPVVGGVTGDLLATGREVVAEGAVGARLLSEAGCSTVSVSGLRPFGPALRVSATTGRCVRCLDGRRALEVLLEAARDSLAPPELGSLGEGLHLVAVAPGKPAAAGGPATAGPAVAVLGRDRGGAGLVLGRDIAEGTLVRFARPDARRLAADLRAAAGRRSVVGAVAFGPRAQLGSSGTRPPGTGLPGTEPPGTGPSGTEAASAGFPAATLWVEAAHQFGPAADGAEARLSHWSTSAVLFTEPGRDGRGPGRDGPGPGRDGPGPGALR